MIITRSPVRVSLYGSSSDLPEWWLQHGGISINFAINKYSWICLKELPPFFDYTTKLTYSEVETVNDKRDIKHRVIRHALEYMDVEGIDLVHQADLFSKCGLGSSSAFATCLMHALSVWKGQFWSKDKLAREVKHLEQNLLKEKIGEQDRMASIYAGLNRFDYYPSGDMTVTPIFTQRDFMSYFESCCLLFFTGIQREAHKITQSYPSLLERERQQFRMIDIAKEGHSELLRGNIERIGALLNETWEEKRQISQNITCNEIDSYYNISKEYAWGFKLLGAGGGGSILILADPSRHAQIKRSLGLVQIPFKIDWNGSKVLYVNESGLRT